MGLMIGVELVHDRATKEPAPDLANRVLDEAKARGLIVGKGGLFANTLRICPPLIISKSDVDEAVRILDDAFSAACCSG
jgi:4-aminobutyrate aminotransferase-like enzyme